MAQKVGERLQAILFANRAANLAVELESLIKDLAHEYGLQPGSAPSTTLSVLQVDNQIVRISVLADSPVIVKLTNGEYVQIRDDRLAEIARSHPRPTGPQDPDDERWIQRRTSIEAYRNRPGGFWAISASPEAASELVVRTVPIHDFESAILMTDGAASLGDRYAPDRWEVHFDSALVSPSDFVLKAFEFERNDPNCIRWLRSKVHDDKALVAVTLSDTAF